MRQAATGSVERPDDDGPELSSARVLHKRVESGPTVSRAADLVRVFDRGPIACGHIFTEFEQLVFGGLTRGTDTDVDGDSILACGRHPTPFCCCDRRSSERQSLI